MPVTLTLVVVLLGADPTTRLNGATRSDLIPPEQAAAIALDAREAEAEVMKKYGDKKLSELSNAERAQLIRDQAEAEKKVLEKHGVAAHTWARQQMAQSPSQVAAQKELEKRLAEKRQADAKAAAAEKEKGSREITVQRGINDANPVTLEEAESTGPTVEQGLPAEAADDQAAAAGQEGATDGTAAPAEAPAKPAGKAAKGGGKAKGGKR